MPPGRVVYRSSHVPILAGGRSIGRSIRRVRPRGNACHTYNRNVIERIGSGSHGQLGSRLGCGCVGCGCRSAGWAGATDGCGQSHGGPRAGAPRPQDRQGGGQSLSPGSVAPRRCDCRRSRRSASGCYGPTEERDPEATDSTAKFFDCCRVLLSGATHNEGLSLSHTHSNTHKLTNTQQTVCACPSLTRKLSSTHKPSTRMLSAQILEYSNTISSYDS